MENLPGIKEECKAGSPLLSTGGLTACPSLQHPLLPSCLSTHLFSETKLPHTRFPENTPTLKHVARQKVKRPPRKGSPVCEPQQKMGLGRTGIMNVGVGLSEISGELPEALIYSFSPH